MATVAAIQAQLDASGKGATIVGGPLFTQSATKDDFVVQGGADGTSGRVNRRVCQTNRGDTAAQQATSILASMRAR